MPIGVRAVETMTASRVAISILSGEEVELLLARLYVDGKQAGVDQSVPDNYNGRMNRPLKIQKIGNSAGVVLPKELLAQLGVEIGSTLSVTPTSRGIELSASNAEFERQMEIAREVMARRRQALRELAK